MCLSSIIEAVLLTEVMVLLFSHTKILSFTSSPLSRSFGLGFITGFVQYIYNLLCQMYTATCNNMCYKGFHPVSQQTRTSEPLIKTFLSARIHIHHPLRID